MIHEPHNRVDVTTPQGDGVIWLVTEYGHETDTIYTIILNNGEIWQFTHKDIRVKDNITFNRVFTKTEKHQICEKFISDKYRPTNEKCLNCGLMKINHPSKSIIAGV
jgi:hypothetical protein